MAMSSSLVYCLAAVGVADGAAASVDPVDPVDPADPPQPVNAIITSAEIPALLQRKLLHFIPPSGATFPA
jgi:hypothetical protein